MSVNSEARAKMRRPPLRMMTLALTGECNLRCRYCYQNAKTGARMPWPVLEASARRLLGTTSPYVDLVFAGGEPLLARDLIERAVEHIERRRPPGLIVRYSLATNGTLLARDTMAFLNQYRFEIELSFDGVESAQSVRGKRSFARIDAALDRLRTDAPEIFWRRLTVGVTLDADAVPFLADSFAYFLDKHLQIVAISPANGQSARWTPPVLDRLGRELRKVYALSRRHYDNTGQVPLVSFRKTPSAAPAGREVVCGAATSGSVTVDVDGETYACPMFTESSQRFANQRLAPVIQPMRTGNVASRAFWRRLAEVPGRAEATGMFHVGAGRHSVHGQCVRCPYHLECRACPLAALAEPGHDDVRRVPDYVCAFNWMLAGLRKKFPVQPDDAACPSLRSLIAAGERPPSGAPAPS
jgi:uncharacterized protein